MFADHFIDAELARKPDYYDGITDPNIEVSIVGSCGSSVVYVKLSRKGSGAQNTYA